jgi:hypothetical protein
METVSVRISIAVTKKVNYGGRPGAGDLAEVTIAETQDVINLDVLETLVGQLVAEAEAKTAAIMTANVALAAAYDAANPGAA